MSKKKLFVIFFAAVVFITVFSACKKTENNENALTSSTESVFTTEKTQNFVPETVFSTEAPAPDTQSAGVLTNSDEQNAQNFETSTVQSTARATQNTTVENTAPSQTETQGNAESTTSKYTKTGDSVFTDDKNNKYLSAVAKKYNIDTDNLAAIYTIPDTNGNIVLEFDGSKDENGKRIRNESTLIAIYSIGKDLNSKRASENASLNEYSEIEMKTMFFTVNKYLIPKFENELKG